MIHQLVIGFLMVCFVVCGHALDYSDLQSQGMACPIRDSCTQVMAKNFTERNCECDRFCAAFQDCCIDAPVPNTSRRYRLKRLSCMTFGSENGVGAYAIDSCPRAYTTSASVRTKCQGGDDFIDPLVSVPVTDASTGATFKNRYCAECNGATPSSLKTWLLVLNCEDLAHYEINDTFVWQNLKYNLNFGAWGVNLAGEFHKCEIAFDKPAYLPGVRLCRPNVISNCPDAFGRLTVKRSCESYMAVVYDTTHVYKNIHCAICHGQNRDTVSCERSWLLTRKRNKPFSFALLLDVNRNDGDIVGVSQKCPSGQKFDPFFKKCRTLVCALPGYTMVNGKCKKD